jgi:hypothetical protein
MIEDWKPLVECEKKEPDTDAKKKLDDLMNLKGWNNFTIWANDKYVVNREEIPAEDHGFEGSKLIWLSIKNVDGSDRHNWREFQWIKNEICGPEWEAIEIYPSEKRLVDSANQYHLFCIPPPNVIPCGFWKREVMNEQIETGTNQTPFPKNMIPEDIRHPKEVMDEIEKILKKAKFNPNEN